VKFASDTAGCRLAAIRIDRRLTQTELAALVGKSKQTISAWEYGLCEIRLADADRCARLLCFSLRDLLAPVDAPVPKAPPSWLQKRWQLQRQIAAAAGKRKAHLKLPDLGVASV
jgi:transcriptional regulator with XRE-family HTH domain